MAHMRTPEEQRSVDATQAQVGSAPSACEMSLASPHPSPREVCFGPKWTVDEKGREFNAKVR